jgi:rhodanese-related sulfurtransferase
MATLKNSPKINLGAVLFLAGVTLILSNSCALAHTDVTAQQARDLIDSTNDLIVVDVREPSEYCNAIGHIPGALNYPLTSGVLEARYEELPKDNPILVVCRSGGRSNAAASFLDSKGFSMVYDMMGGMTAWMWETEPCVVPTTKYGGGTGEPNDPYLIYTAEQMNGIGSEPNDWDKHFKLMANIDLSKYTAEEFNIIGERYYEAGWTGRPFSGVFDGNGHTISNLSYISKTSNNVGLFVYVDGVNALIKDLGLIDPNIALAVIPELGSVVGSLAGELGYRQGGTIVNCYVEGSSVSGNQYVGSLVGENAWHGTIINCYSSGNVSGVDKVGGLAGKNLGTIANSYSSGDVLASGYSWSPGGGGGLVGENNGIINNCNSSTSVSGNDYTGGLVAKNYGIITNCYAASSVSGSGNEFWPGGVGGLVGYNYSGTITNCYSLSSVMGASNVGGLVGENAFGGIILSCYSAGSVTGTTNVGGLVGDNGGEVMDSFWDTQTSGQATSNGGTGKTISEMQVASIFTNAGWDFEGESINGIEDIWSICEGTNYPRLIEQIPAGDFFCPDGITIEDLEFFIEHWRDDNCDPGNDYCQGTDLDLNGTVDDNDLEIIFKNLLQSQQVLPPQPPMPPSPPGPSPPPPKGRGCFPADTPVWVDGGFVQISSVVSGQLAGELHCDTVIDCLERIETVEEHEGTFECRDIVLESGSHMSVVDAHCFMLDSGQWIAAQDLKSGYRLKTLNGSVGIKSVAIRAVPFAGKVYNLKIKGSEHYFVGEDRVIVRDY